MEDIRHKPSYSIDDAARIASQHFGIHGTAKELEGERDQNFSISTGTAGYVLKIANAHSQRNVLELENAAIELAGTLDSLEVPKLIRSLAGDWVVELHASNDLGDSGNGERASSSEGTTYFARCLTFLPGHPLAEIESPAHSLFQGIGRMLGELDRALSNLNHVPAAKRDLKWDLKNAASIVTEAVSQFDVPQRTLLQHYLKEFQRVSTRIDSLRKSVIHNDANDYNILVHPDKNSELALVGLIDFGDMVYSTTIYELAICGAYVLLGKQQPLDAACALVAGYHQSQPLNEAELSVLYPLMCMRLCQSVCIAAEQQRINPTNAYLGVTETPAWETLNQLISVDATEVHRRFSEACSRVPSSPVSGQDSPSVGRLEAREIQSLRERHVGSSLSLSYRQPLHIVRGKGQYLYDASDVTYLDCVNNVCHVGHCRPEVVQAASDQMSLLNTNTRYLHEHVVRYAQRLAGKFPSPLEVCFFVNSGSEANDLALRLARTYTGRRDVLVLDHAYHGHLSSLIELSPYKFNGAGGQGRPAHVHVAPAPDGFRGPFKSADPDCGRNYALQAIEVLEQANASGREVGTFLAESLLGCGGQIPLPDDYLATIYQAIRGAGGVCIADEVQVGFGRVGSHFWGFEMQGVVPDIVTLGKPIGNGHPLAAVVTTREIADAFHNGMEYFNTFGGNPVSCAVGLAVLDVIEKDDLQGHALQVGTWLMEALNALKTEFECVADVRGSGFFLGVELVEDRRTLQPAAKIAEAVVQEMKSRRILLSTDGPFHNVIKFKPPMVFSQGDAERLVMTLKDVLAKVLGPGK